MDNNKNKEVAVKKNIHWLLQESSATRDPEIDTKRFARINLMATIVGTEKIGTITEMLLDDGSGRIVLRCFEEIALLETFRPGESVLVIGRLRKYNGESYVSPEILKKIPSQWLKLRSLELEHEKIESIAQKNKQGVGLEEELPTRQKIIQTIQLLDAGEGVVMSEIMEKIPFLDTERWMNLLLEQGDIYQIRPGRVKVL